MSVTEVCLLPRVSLRAASCLVAITAIVAWAAAANFRDYPEPTTGAGFWEQPLCICSPLDALWMIWFFAYAFRAVGGGVWVLALVSGLLLAGPILLVLVVGLEGTRPFLERLLSHQGPGLLLLMSWFFVRATSTVLGISLLFKSMWLGAAVNFIHGVAWWFVMVR